LAGPRTRVLRRATGKADPVDTGVALFGSALTAATGNANLAFSNQRAFSYTADLGSIAYTKQGVVDNEPVYNVLVWNAGESPRPLRKDVGGSALSGIFPGISPSGDVVAFWDYSANDDALEGMALLRVWKKSKNGTVLAMQVPKANAPLLCPIVSPDDEFIAFLTNFVERGNGYYGGELGSLTLFPLEAADEEKPEDYVFPLGDAVAWRSVSFQPEYRPNVDRQFTRQISFMSNFRELGGTITLTSTLGDLYVGDLTTGTPPKGLDAPLEKGLAPGDVIPLPTTNGFVYVKGGVAWDMNDPRPYLWVPGMSVPRALDAATQGDGDGLFIRGTLRVMPISHTLSAQAGDAIMYRTNVGETAENWGGANEGEEVPEGWIRAVKVITGGETPFRVENRSYFIGAQFSPSGRILGVHDATKNVTGPTVPSPTKTSIRDMPIPTSNPPAGEPPA